MSLDNKELFRLGFLLRCAEERLDDVAIRERVAFGKQAGVFSGWLAGLRIKHAFGAMDILGTVAKAPLMSGTLQTLAGAGLGAAGGYGLAKLTDEDVDPEMAKKYELIAAYRQQAERARRQMARTAYRPTKSVPRLSLTM